MAYSLVVAIAVIVGWKIGEALTPSAAELEGAIDPWVGAALGAVAGGILCVVRMLLRRQDPDHRL